MKYFLLITGLWFCLSNSSKAQYYDHAIGLRAGTAFEASYKRFIFFTPKIQQAFEGLVGFQIDEGMKLFPYDQPINNAFVIEGLWLFHLDLGFDTNFSGFAGGGVYMGLYVQTGLNAPFFGGGITPCVGVEYTFTHLPMTVSIDWKPLIGYPRFTLARGALTIRYLIPTSWH